MFGSHEVSEGTCAKQFQWSNDKTIAELGYRKISWFLLNLVQELLNVSQETHLAATSVKD